MDMEASVATLLDPRPWTFERLQTLPDDGDIDWRRFESIDGALVMSPTPAVRHGLLVARASRAVPGTAGGRHRRRGAGHPSRTSP
jgi:hypothetical protein